jgi:hypothetical protein|nr:MAG TPA: hypothetical protein [Caudoviricetes sp.]
MNARIAIKSGRVFFIILNHRFYNGGKDSVIRRQYKISSPLFDAEAWVILQKYCTFALKFMHELKRI